MSGFPKIFILDDDPEILSLLSEQLKNGTKCEVFTFKTSEELLKDKNLNHADLFILDIMLKEKINGFDVLDKLYCKGFFSPPPVLFISGNDNLINFNEFTKREFKGIFDYILKPFSYEALINRTNLLLKISRYQKEQRLIKQKYDNALWDSLYYSNFYFLVLNCSLEIIKINEKLSYIINLDKDKKSESVLNYITPEYKSIIPGLCDTLIGNDNKYIEFVFDLKNTSGKTISVKWFITFVNDGHNYLLCIGIPLTTKIDLDQDIDSVRHYYKTIVDKDKIMIQSLKNTLGINTKMCICKNQI